MAIGIKCTRAEAGYDLAASKFFGTPTLPLGWEEEYEESVLFFAQIRLADIAPFDKENRLPHTGYLYLFLDTKDGKYHMRPILRYHDGEPALAIDGFNAVVEGYEQYTAAPKTAISFSVITSAMIETAKVKSHIHTNCSIKSS